MESHHKIFIVLDDREFTNGEVRGLVGTRRFGDIIFKRQNLSEHFRNGLPEWAKKELIHIRSSEDLIDFRNLVENSNENSSLFLIASQAGFTEPNNLFQLIERLPFAEEDFTDRLYNPLLIFLRNAHQLIDLWEQYEARPIHVWEKSWKQSQRLISVVPLDLAKINDFLSFTAGSTASRHFNQVAFDNYYYTKSSQDKRKMFAEYSFYNLVPESMKPWLIQPFDYQDHGETASYKMLRYYLADSALQWVHGAFSEESFNAFIDRLFFFVTERAQTKCSLIESSKIARELFFNKVDSRVKQFLEMPEGAKINKFANSANPDFDLNTLFLRYSALFAKYEKYFNFDYLVVGHGDPCFSNILYDQQRFLLKLIDPKGATNKEELLTHPLYDFCKISHSVLGDYDFINNGLYEIGFATDNNLILRIRHINHLKLKAIFNKKLDSINLNKRILRLGEASLFLSMLPLHIDYPNKVIAFILQAKQILDEVEYG